MLFWRSHLCVQLPFRLPASRNVRLLANDLDLPESGLRDRLKSRPEGPTQETGGAVSGSGEEDV